MNKGYDAPAENSTRLSKGQFELLKDIRDNFDTKTESADLYILYEVTKY